jgi:very-short-patch-repair endonuclease
MLAAFTGIAPLTPALSPEGRGGAGVTVSERVKGKKVQPAQVERARTLRSGMTDAERRLWGRLRNRQLGHKFVRQYPIAGYFADFACRECMLVVEADGGQHNPDRDFNRDRRIEAAGYTILRFWNNDILSNTDGVLETILRTIGPIVPSPLRGEGQGEGSIIRTEHCE